MTLTFQFGYKFGYHLIIRQFVIIIFFCRMHCFLFKTIDKHFNQLSEKHRKRHLKSYLSFHYKLCESVEELQTFLRPMFVLITSIFCPLFCYILYYSLKNQEFENNILMILTDFSAIIFLTFIFVFSSIIAMIDIEAKKGLHSVISH